MQKFHLNGHNGYGRKNRDRVGGHQPTMVYDSFGGWKSHFGSKGRKYAKYVFAKQARREHARITKEAVREWHKDWQAEQEHWFWEEWDYQDYKYYYLDY